MFSKAFLFMLIILLPRNAHALLSLYYEEHSLFQLCLMIVILIELWGTLFMHIHAARLVDLIIEPSTELFSYLCTESHRMPSRLKMRLTMMLGDLCCQRKYGLTYSSFGTITLATFAKVHFHHIFFAIYPLLTRLFFHSNYSFSGFIPRSY